MQTVVLQSSRADVPDWVERCMHSVRRWADSAGLAYRFAGDELFDLVPQALMQKTRERRQVASDIARLCWIGRLLDDGWSAVVWLDADVLVLDPDALTACLDLSRGYLLGRETWVQRESKGRLGARQGVHNALCAFRAENPFLTFYLDAAERLVARHAGPMVPQLVGPKLLTALDNLVGLSASWAVNMASPLVLQDIADGGGPALERFRERSGRVPAALNLCQSYVGRCADGVAVDERLLQRAIARMTSGQRSPFDLS